MVLTEFDILEALRACFDPGMRVNVVDLGLVLGVQLVVDAEAPGAGIAGVPVRQRLSLRMLTTDEDEDKWSLLRGQVLNRLLGMEGLSRVEVERVHDAWSPERATPAGRRSLGLDAKVFPILNNRVR